MSSIKDYKPGDMIVDEATGILYDPRYSMHFYIFD